MDKEEDPGVLRTAMMTRGGVVPYRAKVKIEDGDNRATLPVTGINEQVDSEVLRMAMIKGGGT